VVSVPARGRDFAYISCGTWSLVGVELERPVLTDASRAANFTNETGVDGTIRYLRNVMGLWLLQESVRSWADAGRPADLATLLGQAARVPPLRAVIDPDDPVFLPPGDMPARITAACRAAGQPPTEDPPQVLRCIIDSLALAYRRALGQVQELSGHRADTVHIVGGGPATPCCASSPPMPAVGRSWPARLRRPPSATSWSRPGRSAPRPATWTACARWSGPPSPSAATSPIPAPPVPRPPPQPESPARPGRTLRDREGFGIPGCAKAFEIMMVPPLRARASGRRRENPAR
jgi:hypothetical protein